MITNTYTIWQDKFLNTVFFSEKKKYIYTASTKHVVLKKRDSFPRLICFLVLVQLRLVTKM